MLKFGCDRCSLEVVKSVKEGPPNGPTAVETQLGWSMVGPHPIHPWKLSTVNGTPTEHVKLTPTTTRR